MHVDQAGQKGHARGQGNGARACGNGQVSLPAHLGDATIDDQHQRLVDSGSPDHVQHPVGTDRHRIRLGKGAGHEGAEGGAGQQH